MLRTVAERCAITVLTQLNLGCWDFHRMVA